VRGVVELGSVYEGFLRQIDMGKKKEEVVVPEKKRRGRRPGSKNKAKVSAENIAGCIKYFQSPAEKRDASSDDKAEHLLDRVLDELRGKDYDNPDRIKAKNATDCDIEEFILDKYDCFDSLDLGLNVDKYLVPAIKMRTDSVSNRGIRRVGGTDVIFFASLILQRVYYDKKLHSPVFALENDEPVVYQVDCVAMIDFFSRVILTTAFCDTSTLLPCSCMYKHLKTDFKTNPFPPFTTSKPFGLWGDRHFNMISSLSLVEGIELMFNQVRITIKDTLPEVWKSPVPRLSLQHFVSFISAAVVTYGTEATLYSLCGVMWRRMNEDRGLVHPWAMPESEESPRFICGFNSSCDNDDLLLWDHVAGIFEMVLFNCHSKGVVRTCEYEPCFFLADAGALYNLMRLSFIKLGATYSSIEDARRDVVPHYPFREVVLTD
jgi:hypothetical protein